MKQHILKQVWKKRVTFFSQTGSETLPAAGSLFWEKMVRCCLTVLRIRKKWKITVTDRNLLKLRSRDPVRWSAIQTPYQNRRFTML